jgi:excisionase family DNA binding protein
LTKKIINKSYLTPNQVAELLMVSPTAVRQWAEKGDLAALMTPGGHRRFLPREVERFASVRGLTLNHENISGKLRVLVVDDDALLLSYLTCLLEEFSDQVIIETAKDGFEAGLKLSEFAPQVVLLDLMMPGLNGFMVCERLKADPKMSSIRVIAMTGYPSAENDKNIVAAGAEVCLPKPIDAELLIEYIGLTPQLNNANG